MDKPYIKKFGEIEGFTVWIVDGKYIRNSIDVEFSNYGQHYIFKFIPENEFWIDEEMIPGEEQYYIDSMLLMNKLMKEKVHHDIAVKMADEKEKKDRIENYFKDNKITEEQIRADPTILHKKCLKKYSDKVKIWIVDGEAVRTFFFIDFTEGGHGYIYPFIPKDEVWIDDDLDKEELEFVLLHELHERALMIKGWCYDITTEAELKTGTIKKSAHQSASKIESHCRHNPEDLKKELKKALEENNL